ncbi:hypothetical protein AM587_10004277 [Phytophthora nicotianae]|uniref:Uncharacterized protein n=1 Tax=Phytophthora nicotianae TaxID=4792 RepID=A0A0W8D650_PHYNI|nr:hypothetical protein AM587_10004277 [Phytophthora nicotianae]
MFVATIEALTREHVALLDAVRGRRARGEQRETIQLPRAVELSTESEDSSSDEDDTEMQDSDADNRDQADATEDAESVVTSSVVGTWYEIRGAFFILARIFLTSIHLPALQWSDIW